MKTKIINQKTLVILSILIAVLFIGTCVNPAIATMSKEDRIRELRDQRATEEALPVEAPVEAPVNEVGPMESKPVEVDSGDDVATDPAPCDCPPGYSPNIVDGECKCIGTPDADSEETSYLIEEECSLCAVSEAVGAQNIQDMYAEMDDETKIQIATFVRDSAMFYQENENVISSLENLNGNQRTIVNELVSSDLQILAQRHSDNNELKQGFEQYSALLLKDSEENKEKFINEPMNMPRINAITTGSTTGSVTSSTQANGNEDECDSPYSSASECEEAWYDMLTSGALTLAQITGAIGVAAAEVVIGLILEYPGISLALGIIFAEEILIGLGMVAAGLMSGLTTFASLGNEIVGLALLLDILINEICAELGWCPPDMLTNSLSSQTNYETMATNTVMQTTVMPLQTTVGQNVVMQNNLETSTAASAQQQYSNTATQQQSNSI